MVATHTLTGDPCALAREIRDWLGYPNVLHNIAREHSPHTLACAAEYAEDQARRWEMSSPFGSEHGEWNIAHNALRVLARGGQLAGGRETQATLLEQAEAFFGL